jgi:Protein of unknown function (DUF2721)
MDLTVSELIPVLQISIGPVVLISGIGLLILSMTNRLGRVIDRGRSLARELPDLPEQLHSQVKAQLIILSHRAILLRESITFATISVLLAAALIIVLFVTAILHLEVAWLILLLFMGGMGTLIVSLIAFLQDLNQSLIAFKLDIGQ